MTFILSEINHTGIIMASDSSETNRYKRTGEETFEEVEKTRYFPSLNVGISSWGDASVGGMRINEWLDRVIADFSTQWAKQPRKSAGVLEELAAFLANELDHAFGLDGKELNRTIKMGLHVAGYNSSAYPAPGICHVHILPNIHFRFQPQQDLLALPKEMPAFHLRNGMYEEFAAMWPALSGIDEAFRGLFKQNYANLIKNPEDPIRLRAEWLGNWVKQMCLTTKTAGMPEYIGKTVRILTFNHDADARCFQIREMVQTNCP